MSSSGFCLGGLVKVGKCGSTPAEQAARIVNTAMAKSYYDNVFKCSSKIDAGNTVTAAGECSCAELGIGNTLDCLKDRESQRQTQADICKSTLAAAAGLGLTPDEITCICKSGGGGCNIDVSQTSLVSSQQDCVNKQDAKQSLADNFATNLATSIKSSSQDLGGLFDSSSSDAVIKLANTISQSITTQMMSDISQRITAKNVVKAGCGGLNFGITQYSQFSNILDVLNADRSIQQASAQLTDQVKTSLERKDEGFTGLIMWLVIGGCILLVVCFVLYIIYTKWWLKRLDPARPTGA